MPAFDVMFTFSRWWINTRKRLLASLSFFTVFTFEPAHVARIPGFLEVNFNTTTELISML